MNRAQQKSTTRERILGVAVRRMRELGLDGAGVNAVMKAAGLTHGGFYSHFESRDDLAVQALVEATRQQRQHWISGIEKTPCEQRAAHLAARYLSPTHRNNSDTSCPVPSIAGDLAHASEPLRQAFQEELLETVQTLQVLLDDEGGTSARREAMGTMALCIGGMVMARAVADRELSDEILAAARALAGEVKHREAS